MAVAAGCFLIRQTGGRAGRAGDDLPRPARSCCAAWIAGLQNGANGVVR